MVRRWAGCVLVVAAVGCAAPDVVGVGPVGGSPPSAATGGGPADPDPPAVPARPVVPPAAPGPAPGSPVGGGGGGAPVVTSPLDLPPFQIVGAPYAGQAGAVEQQIRDACGGPLCVTFGHEFDGSAAPPTLDCTVTAIRQPEPLARGDHVVFELGAPCGADEAVGAVEGPAEGTVEGPAEGGGTAEDGDGP